MRDHGPRPRRFRNGKDSYVSTMSVAAGSAHTMSLALTYRKSEVSNRDEEGSTIEKNST